LDDEVPIPNPDILYHISTDYNPLCHLPHL